MTNQDLIDNSHFKEDFRTKHHFNLKMRIIDYP